MLSSQRKFSMPQAEQEVKDYFRFRTALALLGIQAYRTGTGLAEWGRVHVSLGSCRAIGSCLVVRGLVLRLWGLVLARGYGSGLASVGSCLAWPLSSLSLPSGGRGGGEGWLDKDEWSPSTILPISTLRHTTSAMRVAYTSGPFWYVFATSRKKTSSDISIHSFPSIPIRLTDTKQRIAVLLGRNTTTGISCSGSVTAAKTCFHQEFLLPIEQFSTRLHSITNGQLPSISEPPSRTCSRFLLSTHPGKKGWYRLQISNSNFEPLFLMFGMIKFSV